ncbi:hypothetical protein BO86DRAFT_425905 [Aspergillus japonicus CBS 114.51]|uniref:Uncharacterized protein n=1 Tax=Aspergillus japonicus CBS 114.51 TaxID=1448312 RepID=A0A8T8X6H7_ASPJA|nr:hypothetical protein BO86DRAFT_425905 [Aspergillus japonicus CBS 114.51]RAH83777.1 hypothetical protein BO86DRAFT_425905 [Aspergillus japonicus CBS 114.51]
MPSLASQHLLPQDIHARVEDWILRDDEDPPRFYKKLLADQNSIRATQTAQPKAFAQSNASATLPAAGGCSPSHLAGTKPTAPGDEKLNRYKRRMRHKTKDDRYDYKETKVQKKLERLSKHLRRAIAHKFHAPNVAQDRLTINHRPDLGIFKKGKTSSPIKSRGTLASDTLEFPFSHG